ncbi:hypothetical protein [Aegicerativicinus sediminis]|uniref:hypothetical protein n=1 Tax=Aegicerativicinus sediminis TaxID=2893202 RepID=UPI001E544374|nr:hypothetical protein [Aegicerativicinus sediminis]
MNKIIFFTLLSIFITSCSSTSTTTTLGNNKPIYYDFADKVSTEQLQFIQSTYGWDNEEILIIHYNQPISSCHFDNNKITSQGKKFRKDFYATIDTENCLYIQVLSNGERVKNKLDNITYFDDADDFLLDNFFKRKKSCFGVLVINQTGSYFQFNGHYSEKQVATFIEELKS